MRDPDSLLSYCRDEAHHESGVMRSRLTALLSSQSFLLIAYATSMASANRHWAEPFTLLIPPVLAILGFALALEGRSGIRASRDALRRWYRRIDELHHDHAGLASWNEDADRLAAARRAGEVFPLRAPRAFMIAWAWFALLPVALYLTG